MCGVDNAAMVSQNESKSGDNSMLINQAHLIYISL